MYPHLVNNNVEWNSSKFECFLRYLLYIHIHKCVRHILKRSKRTNVTFVLDFATNIRWKRTEKLNISEVWSLYDLLTRLSQDLKRLHDCPLLVIKHMIYIWYHHHLHRLLQCSTSQELQGICCISCARSRSPIILTWNSISWLRICDQCEDICGLTIALFPRMDSKEDGTMSFSSSRMDTTRSGSCVTVIRLKRYHNVSNLSSGKLLYSIFKSLPVLVRVLH